MKKKTILPIALVFIFLSGHTLFGQICPRASFHIPNESRDCETNTITRTYDISFVVDLDMEPQIWVLGANFIYDGVSYVAGDRIPLNYQVGEASCGAVGVQKRINVPGDQLIVETDQLSVVVVVGYYDAGDDWTEIRRIEDDVPLVELNAGGQEICLTPTQSFTLTATAVRDFNCHVDCLRAYWQKLENGEWVTFDQGDFMNHTASITLARIPRLQKVTKDS